MKLLLLLALCVTASAAPPPIPRPKPALSPKHASQPKSTPMFIPASVPPKLPMQYGFVVVSNEFGNFEFTASALQPANQTVLFEVAPVTEPNAWEPLAWFDAQPADQKVFAALYSYSDTLFIRANATAAPPTTLSAVAGAKFKVNPKWHVRPWRVKK